MANFFGARLEGGSEDVDLERMGRANVSFIMFLTGVDRREDVDLGRGTNFSFAKLEEALFIRTTLTGAYFEGATLPGAKFIWGHAHGGEFPESHAHGGVFLWGQA